MKTSLTKSKSSLFLLALLISSPLFEEEDYTPVVKDYTDYIQRSLK